jgi:hypothetical protein
MSVMRAFQREAGLVDRKSSVVGNQRALLEDREDAMPTLHVEAELSRNDLIKAVNQLDPDELNRFVSEVLLLRAKRQGPTIPASAAQLLLRINQGLPEDLAHRHRELMAQRDATLLGQGELAELLRLTGQAEAIEADRVAALAKLARSRGVSLDQLMSDLGIVAPTVS